MIEFRRRHSGVSAPSSRLPKEYQEVEYIESNNNLQYINLNLRCPNGFLIKTRFLLTGYFINGSPIIAANEDSPPYKRNLFYVSTNKETALGLGESAVRSDYTHDLNTLYEVEASTIKGRSFIKINGETILESDNSDDRTSKSLHLFHNNYSADRQNFLGRIYETEISDDVSLVRHLIPCYRKADNVAGMYDIVNGVFHINAGTGEFIVGPDVIG